MIWGGGGNFEMNVFFPENPFRFIFSEAVPGKKKISRRKVPPAPPQIINGRPLNKDIHIGIECVSQLLVKP